jgi:hypothetical protein
MRTIASFPPGGWVWRNSPARATARRLAKSVQAPHDDISLVCLVIMMRKFFSAAAIVVAMAACAPAPPPPPPTPPAPPPLSVDGIYHGTATRFEARSRTCPHPGLVTIVVQNNQFQYHWAYQSYVDSTIAPDGTIQGTGPDSTLVGRRDGNRLEGDVTNGDCGLHFTVTKADL